MPPARRKSTAASLPGASPLPEVRLVADRPDAAVLVLPTRAADDVVAPVAELEGVDVLALLRAEGAKGDAGEVVSVPVLDGGALERVLLAGVGGATPRELRKAGAAVARRAKSMPAVTVDLRGLGLDQAAVRALVEGLLLASYGFTWKPRAEPRPLREVVLVGADAVGVMEAVVVARATAFARDLVNTPPRELSPDALAKAAAARCADLQVTVRDDAALRAEGFGGLVAVGQGSSRPPRLVEVTYDGGGTRSVALVGKGITFDTGGLSLKPGPSMPEMKSDMGGAAAVLGAVRAAADLQLPIKVTALLALAENMPSGDAQRPGDVIRQYGGRTVEVLNTDAEGRLVLADALVYADRDLQADVVVDVATLTGAMPVALGKKIAGLFAADDALAAQLEAAAASSGERVWRMPLVEDYRQALDSPVADLRNIGDPRKKLQGGSITAALFLREFTGGRPWAHLDIAGPAFAGGDEEELTKGGTGYGVRLLTAWLQALSSAPARRTRRATPSTAAARTTTRTAAASRTRPAPGRRRTA